MLSAFLTLFGVPGRYPQGQPLDPIRRRQRTLNALKCLLLRESQTQPLLLVVEDLHWSDTETRALQDSLIEGLATAPILLLVSYRAEYQHEWGGKMHCA
jgi:predicted ATPase